MVEGVFAEEVFAAGFVEGEEAGHHGFRGSGFGVGDGLLEGDAGGGGIEGDVGEAGALDALGVAEAEVDAFGGGQVGGQAADEEVVLGGDGALDASSGGRAVLADAEAFLGGTFEECVADDHGERTLAGEIAEGIGEGDDFFEARGAFGAGEEMLFDMGLFLLGERGEPVVGEEGGVDGVGAAHAATPMQPRSWWMARWRMTRTLASETPRKPATSVPDFSS